MDTTTTEDEEEVVPPEIKSGAFIFKEDGARYEGEFVEVEGERVRQGFGRLTFGPEEYEGRWECDHLVEGKIRFATGAEYEGSLENGRFSGKGRYSWPDGSLYVGNWRDNKMHGEGRYTDNRAVDWDGQFFNGTYLFKALLTHAQGSTTTRRTMK